MKKNILILGEVMGGGEWTATTRLMKALSENYAKINLSFLGYGEKKSSSLKIYKLKTFIKHSEAKRPFSFFKKLYLDFNKVFVKLKSLQTVQKFDFIFSTDYLMLLSASLSKNIGVKTIFLFEGTKSSPFKSFKDVGVRQIFVWFLETLAFTLCDFVVYPSHYGKKYIEKRLGVLKFFKKTYFVPNFVEKACFGNIKKSQKAKIRNKYNIPKNKNVVLYSGRIVRKKGLENLVSAFNEMELKYPNPPILIIAHMDTGLELDFVSMFKQRVAKNKVIKLIANSSFPELINIYQMSDLLILPSEIEVAPFAPIEAMAGGTPFTGTATGNMGEILNEIEPRLILTNNSAEEIQNKTAYFFSLPKNKITNLKTKSRLLALRYLPSRSIGSFAKILMT